MSSTGPSPHIVQRLRVAVEAAGSFAVDKTGTLASFTDLPVMEGTATWEPVQATVNPLHALQDVRDYQVEVIGKKSWSLTFSLALAPTGVAASGAQTAAAGPLSPLLKTIMGGEFRGKGSTAATGGWATSGGGGVANASGFRAGGIAGIVHGGQLHLRSVKQVTGATGGSLVVRPRFPAAPASGSTIYSGATYFWSKDPKESLQFIVEGQEAQDRWVLMGGQGTFTPELNLDGEVQSLQFQITGTKWLLASDSAGASDIHGTAIGNATYSNYEPITGHAGELSVRTNGELAFTGAAVNASAIAFESGFTHQPVPSPSGVEGVLRYRMIRASGTPPVAGSWSTYFESYARHNDKTNKRALGVFYRNGVTAGSAVAIEAPTVQVVNVQRDDQSGIAGEVVEFRGRKNATTTLPTSPSTAVSDMGTSPLLIHLA